MKKLFIIIIILLLKTFPSLGAVGDVYNCSPKQIHVFLEGSFYELKSEKNTSNFITKHSKRLVWLEKSIILKSEYNKTEIKIPFRWESSKDKVELFMAHYYNQKDDGVIIVSFKNGFLNYMSNHPFLDFMNKVETYNCKKV